MAIPRVFVSSTCYDLKHIRENLKYFIRTIGYEPVLSEEGDVFYSPATHTHDSCLKEVSTCQLFVLIIGGRFGEKYRDDDKSITNREYLEAVSHNIPVFTLVESAVYSDHHLFITNKKDNEEFASKIKYPSCDSVKIFKFINDVRHQSVNNALFSFKDFSDIESYLRKQWAGMMFEFLDRKSQEKQSEITNKLLDNLSVASKKTEELVKALIRNVDDAGAEEKIRNIANSVDAEVFAKKVLDRFHMEKLYNTSINMLNEIDLNKSWVDFLVSTPDFRIEEIENDEDNETAIVLWGTASHGLQIGHYDSNGVKAIDAIKDIEHAYEALREANTDVRTKVYSLLVNGFNT